ncbi:15166_t:CDS:1, partial [Funneliformis mosseae]
LKTRQEVQQILTKWIKEALSLDYHVAVIGDFNADMDRQHNPTNTLKYFDTLLRMSMFNAFTLKHDCARIRFPS